MADFETPLAQAQEVTYNAVSGERLSATDTGGVISKIAGSFTATEAVAAGKTIRLCRLPSAVRITGLVLYADDAATFNVGHETYFEINSQSGKVQHDADTDALNAPGAVAVTANSARVQTFPNVVFRSVDGVWLTAEVTGATSFAKDKTLHFIVEYYGW